MTKQELAKLLKLMHTLEIENMAELRKHIGSPPTMQPEEYAWLLFEQRMKVEDALFIESTENRNDMRYFRLTDFERDLHYYVNVEKDDEIIQQRDWHA